MEKRNVARVEIFGFFFIVIIGSLLHFVFEWSGGRTWVAIFAAVNESTWEHLKLVFYPALVFSILEYPFLKRKTSNFFFAKIVSFYVMPIVIIVLFYGYLAIFKEDSLFWDILVFVVAVAAGQYANFKILTMKKLDRKYKIISIILFFLILVPFLTLTYFPPQNILFKDPLTGGFGIIK